MKLYQNYIFDLYGTLVDIRTDEEQRALWDKMCLLYGGFGAVYTPEELHALYKKLVSEKEKSAKEKNARESSIKEQNMGYQGGEQNRRANERLYAHESYPEIPIEDVFRELFAARGIMPSEEFVIYTGYLFRVLSTSHIRLYAGARELLQRLHEKNRGVYLLSNAQRIFTERELRYLRIEDCFDGILISSDYGVKKPDERFFRILLKKYRIAPECALMIGNDLDSDIAGAKAAGMDTFYIHSGISPVSSRKVDADYAMKKMNLKVLQKRLLEEQ